MKKILNSLIFIVILLFSFSCFDEETRFPELIQGALPNLQMDLTKDDVINAGNFNATNAAFTIDLQEGKENAASIRIMVSFNNSARFQYDEVTTWPSNVAITGTKLDNLFPDTVFTKTELEIGDIFTFTADVVLKNGMVLKAEIVNGEWGYHADFFSQTHVDRTFFLDYRVNCPSDLAGTYTCVTTGTGGGGLGALEPYSNTREVTLTALGGGEYNFNEAFGGLYDHFYGIYYGGGDIPGSYIAQCGEIIASPTINDPWGALGSVSGSINQTTGVITIDWDNAFGDSAKMVLTPKN